MDGDSIWHSVIRLCAPVEESLRAFDAVGPLGASCILACIAVVLIRGYRNYDMLRVETEHLFRRYIVFRGKKQSVLRSVGQGSETDDILKSVARSWDVFKSHLAEKIERQRNNYVWTKKWLMVGVIFLLLNTLRGAVTGLLIWKSPSGFLMRLYGDIAYYFLPIVGMAVLAAQRSAVREGGTNHTGSIFDMLSGDSRDAESALYEEFDPLEESGRN